MNNYKYHITTEGRYYSVEQERDRKYMIFGAIVAGLVFISYVVGTFDNKSNNIVSPVPSTIPTPTLTPTPTVSEVNHSIEGTASYYSREGCLGCTPSLVMANGEELDDTKLTVALTPETVSKHKLLNDIVKIVNKLNGKEVYAKVTDTGGFSKYNRVADLNLATKNALACSSLCEVKILWK